MSELFELDSSKKYDHQETRSLLADVRNFYQSKLKIIIPEWITPKASADQNENSSIAEIFYIEKAAEPIYAECNGYDDLNGILRLFEERLNELLDGLDHLLDNNSDMDDETRNSLESYADAIEKCGNVYGTQKRKRAAKFKELSTVNELREELQQLFSEMIARYIVVLFDALYERIHNGAGPVYALVVKEINTFLAANGVYTRMVSAGEKLDPEYMEPTPDSSENITEDFSKFDVIDEIRRYPYVFADDVKIADGLARIFRRKD